EDRQEAPRHQVVEFLFGFGQRLRRETGRNDREVVRDLGIVEYALVGVHPSRAQDVPGQGAITGLFERAQRVLDGAEIILGQVAAVGTRIGQGLVAFVQ